MKAKGILVFPRVIDGGVIVGGEYGRGALSVDGRVVGSYKVTSISLGLQAGLQSQSLVLMFMTQEAFDRFTRDSSWTAGADASVAIGRVGANGRLETFGNSGVIAFALTNARPDGRRQGRRHADLEGCFVTAPNEATAPRVRLAALGPSRGHPGDRAHRHGGRPRRRSRAFPTLDQGTALSTGPRRRPPAGAAPATSIRGVSASK